MTASRPAGAARPTAIRLRVEPGVTALSRVISAARARRLAVRSAAYDCPGEGPALLVLDVEADPAAVDLAARQLARLVDVYSVELS